MRRPNGYGTIVKLSGTRRNPWAVRIASRDSKNRVQQKYLSYHATSQAALDALNEYNRNIAAGTAPASDNLTMTLGQVYAAWSDRAYARLKAGSVTSSRAAWKRVSILADVKMRKVTTDQLQTLIDKDEAAGLSKSSISNDALLLKNLYNYAMERDIVGKDYSAYIQLPKIAPKQERRPFTDAEFAQLEAMAAAGVPWADTVVMLCYTGWRVGEFLALTPADYHADGNYLQGGSKTEAGKDRIVPVHPKIKPYLDAWLSKKGAAIICDESGAAITQHHYRAHCFTALLVSIGTASATPHWCRYTFASHLQKAGVDELTRKRLLGHSDKDVTEHYTKTDLAQLIAGINQLP